MSSAGKKKKSDQSGSQRLSLEQLYSWQKLGFGMFIHFGMSTYDGVEFSPGKKPATHYAPDHLDVDQWVSVVRDTGMKYAVLTTKHHSGFSLWPSRWTDYHVGNSRNKTNVVEKFVKACQKRGVKPGFYYASWDNHHRFGSMTPNCIDFRYDQVWTTPRFREFMSNQIEELLTQFGKIAEVWVDSPRMLPRDYRNELYQRIAQLQPETIIVTNHGPQGLDYSRFSLTTAWPCDVIGGERYVPDLFQLEKNWWRTVEGKRYYVPGEVCDTVGKHWFHVKGDEPRSDQDLLGMYLLCRGRNANYLLDVGPDKHGKIPPNYMKALQRLRKNIDRVKA